MEKVNERREREREETDRASPKTMVKKERGAEESGKRKGSQTASSAWLSSTERIAPARMVCLAK